MDTIAKATLKYQLKAENCETNEQTMLLVGAQVEIKSSPYMTRDDYYLIDHEGFQTIAHASELNFEVN